MNIPSSSQRHCPAVSVYPIRILMGLPFAASVPHLPPFAFTSAPLESREKAPLETGPASRRPGQELWQLDVVKLRRDSSSCQEKRRLGGDCLISTAVSFSSPSRRLPPPPLCLPAGASSPFKYSRALSYCAPLRVLIVSPVITQVSVYATSDRVMAT